MITWFKFVSHGQMLAHFATGWRLECELHGTSHGNWSVLMRWAGEGEPS